MSRQSRHASRAEQSIVAIETKFNAGLETAKPLLFSLAGQISDAQPNREWDLLLGDDTSGRPVAHYVRQVLALQGTKPPMAFFCASQQTRQHVSNEKYVDYLQQVATRNSDPQRVLLVSENIGTGETAKYISHLLRGVFPEVDFATVASYFESPDIGADNVYVGGSGEEAWRAVFDTFEDTLVTSKTKAWRNKAMARVIPESLKPLLLRTFPQTRTSTSYPLTNLVSSTEHPYAEISPDPTYRDLSQRCYKRMGELAMEFVHTEFQVADRPPVVE